MSIIELDDRRRAPLAKHARKGDTRYVVETHPDGTLVLRPAFVFTAEDLDLLAHPGFIAKLRKADTDVDTGKGIVIDSDEAFDELLNADA